MEKWECTQCGFVYDPENGDPSQGVKPKTKYSDLPDDWQCPRCQTPKDQFEEV